MDADEEIRLNQITEKNIGCAYRVRNVLGCGFLEKVYENAMAYELRKANLKSGTARPVEVMYDGICVGSYFADLYVEDTVLVELKAIRVFEDIHFAQCIHYLTATGYPICLLINFGKRVEIKRFENSKSK
jgi:GxxExxY protein